MVPQIQNMIRHQILMGGLVEGDCATLRLGGDGTTFTRSDHCTVHTITLANSEKALQIALVSIVLAPESYEVFLDFFSDSLNILVFRCVHACL